MLDRGIADVIYIMLHARGPARRSRLSRMLSRLSRAREFYTQPYHFQRNIALLNMLYCTSNHMPPAPTHSAALKGGKHSYRDCTLFTGSRMCAIRDGSIGPSHRTRRCESPAATPPDLIAMTQTGLRSDKLPTRVCYTHRQGKGQQERELLREMPWCWSAIEASLTLGRLSRITLKRHSCDRPTPYDSSPHA